MKFLSLPDSPLLHGTIDSVAMRIGNLLLPAYFRDGAESPGFDRHLDDIDIDLPEITDEGDYDVVADTLVGELDATIRLARWTGGDVPTIIYHHGAGEIPFDGGFNAIFPEDDDLEANLIVVRRPFHRSLDEFKDGVLTVSNVLAEQAVAVGLTELLVRYIRDRTNGIVCVSGLSLGGFVTNLHHIHCDSADVYVPLLAGVAEDDVFFDSIYNTGVAQLSTENVEALRDLLNFEAEFAQTDHTNVYPLLARYDRVVRYDVQRASYGTLPVETIRKGHVTGGIAAGSLRSHLLRHLEGC